MALQPSPPGPSLEQLSVRLGRLELRNRQLARWLALVGFVSVLILLGITQWPSGAQAEQAASPPVLTVRELVVVDDKNIPRVRVGASLPDPVIDGKRIGRGGEQVAGVMLYDASGQERGGYLTFEPSGNVGLTLDSRQRQTAALVAGADGGSAFQLWTPSDLIELRSDPNGSRLTASKQGTVVQQIPAIETITPGTCSAYKEALSRVSRAQATKDCQRRFPSGACSKCLGTK
jgi:hypothetical protein